MFTRSLNLAGRQENGGVYVKRRVALQTCGGEVGITPECCVEFGEPDEMILHTVTSLNADVIIMGLHRSAHIGTASHTPWATAYNVVRRANCPVLTVRS